MCVVPASCVFVNRSVDKIRPPSGVVRSITSVVVPAETAPGTLPEIVVSFQTLKGARTPLMRAVVALPP